LVIHFFIACCKCKKVGRLRQINGHFFAFSLCKVGLYDKEERENISSNEIIALVEEVNSNLDD